MLIEWDGSLDIGHELIDAQHRSLVDIINRLHMDRLSGAGREHIRAVLMDLYKYTLFHFGEEEGIMRAACYPAAVEHKAEHEAFIARLDTLASRLKTGDEQVAADTFNWLVGWLLDHITLMDRKLAVCLAKG